ncbi:hypothetical protein [Nonomuraea salmonea]|uniref:hypothetical protein n=1 Tax=Nonomuraea salmonea TaxID=46181 RepID=UPI002FE97E4B
MAAAAGLVPGDGVTLGEGKGQGSGGRLGMGGRVGPAADSGVPSAAAPAAAPAAASPAASASFPGAKKPWSELPATIDSMSARMSSAVTVPVKGGGGCTLILMPSTSLHPVRVTAGSSSACAVAAGASRAADVAVSTAMACLYMLLPMSDDRLTVAIITLSGGSITP